MKDKNKPKIIPPDTYISIVLVLGNYKYRQGATSEITFSIDRNPQSHLITRYHRVAAYLHKEHRILRVKVRPMTCLLSESVLVGK